MNLDLKHSLVKNHSRIDYRIGDGFYYLSGDNDFRNKTLLEYPNTILSEYLLKTNKNKDYKTIIDIINSKKYSLPLNCLFKNNYVLIHLRIGDIMEGVSHDIFIKKAFHDQDSYNYNLPKNDFFYNSSKYIVPLAWYPNLLYKLNHKNILIIASSHVKLNTYTNSLIYIKEVEKIFKNGSNNIFTILGGHPDNDLLYVKGCTEFIRSSGNYSKLLSELAINYGKPIDYHPKVKEYWP